MRLYKVTLGYTDQYDFHQKLYSYVLAEDEKIAGEKMLSTAKSRDYQADIVSKIELIADTEQHYFHSKLIM